MTAALPWL